MELKDYNINIVLGSLFGDEGKGNSVQWLCKKALEEGKNPLVIRFSGGAQAGHRVVNETNEHICSLIGAGVLLGVPTYLNENVYIDPVSLKREYEILINKGFKPKLYINERCRVVSPYDKIADFGDENVQKHGTTGCGIHATFVRYNSCKRIYRGDVAIYCPEDFLDDVKKYYEKKLHKKITIEEKLIKEYIEAGDWFRETFSRSMDADIMDADIIFVKDMPINDKAFYKPINSDLEELDIEVPEFDTLIFEGSQGLLLDMDNGFMPHCTPSRVGLNGIDEKYLNGANVYLVMRSYLTRHGNGFNPKDEDIVRKNYKNLFEASNFDHGPQGKFKIGLLEHRLIRDAFVRHRLDNYYRMNKCLFNLIITHMDCVNNDQLLIKSGKQILFENPGDISYDFGGLGFVPENIYLGYGPNSDIRYYEGK